MKKQPIWIPIVISLFLFILLNIPAYGFNIRPGAYAYIETDQSLIVSHGIFHPEIEQIPYSSSRLHEILITTEIDRIRTSWFICTIMLSVLSCIGIILKFHRQKIRRYIILMIVACLYLTAHLYQIFQALTYLNHMNF